MVTAYEAEELPGLRANATRGHRFHGVQSGRRWGEHTYQTGSARRNSGTTRRSPASSSRSTGGSPPRGSCSPASGNEAGAVEPFLHSYLAERVIGTAKLNPKDATPPWSTPRRSPYASSGSAASERALVQEMLRRRQPAGRSTASDETLRRARARTGARAPGRCRRGEPGYRCGDSGRLARTERECRGEGEPMPVLDVVDDAIEEALRQRIASTWSTKRRPARRCGVSPRSYVSGDMTPLALAAPSHPRSGRQAGPRRSRPRRQGRRRRAARRRHGGHLHRPAPDAGDDRHRRRPGGRRRRRPVDPERRAHDALPARARAAARAGPRRHPDHRRRHHPEGGHGRAAGAWASASCSAPARRRPT